MKECGPLKTGYRQVADERTGPGGAWQFGPIEYLVPTYYRARWNRATSRPLFVPTGLSTNLRVQGRTLIVEVDTRGTGQRMRGRIVHLQRRAGNRWQVVRTTRLTGTRLEGSFGGAVNMTDGGAWRWTYTNATFDEAAWFRARWTFYTSRKVLVRGPLPSRPRARAGSRPRHLPDRENMGGRAVELQRQAGERRVLVRKGTLRRVGGHRYAASLRVVERGLTLRVHVPARSARPCYLPGSTRPWGS